LSSKTKRMCGIGAMVAGAVMVIFSLVIKAKVREGSGQIYSAEQSLSKSQGMFNQSPATKSVGGLFTSGANKKISEGKDQVAFYTTVSNVLLVAGIALIVVGGGCTFFGRKSAR